MATFNSEPNRPQDVPALQATTYQLSYQDTDNADLYILAAGLGSLAWGLAMLAQYIIDMHTNW